ncbi:hypothetical protein BKA70DRAFT_837714 [Coprinopsis sp. MPI-PUGE-AT-0042]|nr:hypothetical protein BKA70DRAFT_837714 [Coprinopsis sp. MPI-PUGE-AT-0042]
MQRHFLRGSVELRQAYLPIQTLAAPFHPQADSSSHLSPRKSTTLVFSVEEPPLPHKYGPVKSICSVFGNVMAGANRGTVNMIFEHTDFMSHLPEQLKISPMAEYMYYPSGDEELDLLRGCCTPGTRITIPQAILRCATDTSPGGERVFWLSGQAGSGKSTIAYTICQQLDFLVGDANTKTILGGSFFCSRLFHDFLRLSTLPRGDSKAR